MNNENPLCLLILLIICTGEVSSEKPFAKFMPSLAGPEAPALPPLSCSPPLLSETFEMRGLFSIPQGVMKKLPILLVP